MGRTVQGYRAAAAGYPPPVVTRSHAAIPAVIVVALVGLYLASYTVIIPAIIGLLLFSVGLTFVSARINPLSTSFYLTTKPSGLAIVAVFFAGFGLLYASYLMYLKHYAPVVPHF
jgi:hypothetical protein